MSILLSRLAVASLAVLLLAPLTTRADILFVSDPATSTVYQVPSGGTTTGGTVYATLAGNTEGLAFDQGGNLYVASFSTQNLTKVPAGGGTPNPNFATNLSTPEGVAVDSAGNIYVANNGSSGGSPLSITKITPGGVATTFASGFTGGAGPIGLAFDSSGNLYAAVPNPGTDTNGKPLGEVVKITPAGTTTGGTPFATGLNSPFGLAFDKAGNLYVSDISANTISKVSPDGSTVSLFASGFSTPEGLAVDSLGNVYVADIGRGSVRLVPQGNTTGGSSYASGFTAPGWITFQATATPEPSSLALLSVAASAMAGCGWWGRRRCRSAEPQSVSDRLLPGERGALAPCSLALILASVT